MDKSTQLKNKIHAINAIHRWYNKNSAALHQILVIAKYKTDGGFYQKDINAFRAITKTAPGGMCHMFAETCWNGANAGDLMLKISWPTGDFGCQYYERHIYMYSDTTPPKLKTNYKYETIMKNRARLHALEEKIQELRIKANKLEVL
jgi:hypothetical protein